jgi:hypothetical protein
LNRPEQSASDPSTAGGLPRIDDLTVGALLLAVLLFALRLLDLEADLPWDLSWSTSVYHDEGIYARNAVWWVETGRWLIPADYNTALNYPVPFLFQSLAFRVLGTGLFAARLVSVAFAGGLIVVSGLLARRTLGNLAAALVVLLLASHPLLFFYSRYAHLDVAMVFWCVLAVLLMTSRRPTTWRVVAAGVAALLALLTKTSAVFVIPVLAFVPLVAAEYRDDRIRPVVWLMATLVVGWLLYLVLWVFPHAADYAAVAASVTTDRMRFDAGWILSGFLLALANLAVRDSTLTIVALLSALFLPLLHVFSRREKVVLAGALLWLACYLGLIGLTHYLPTRYFVPAVPAMALIAGLALTTVAGMGRGGRVLAIAAVTGIVADQTIAIAVYLAGPNHSMHDVAGMITRDLERTAREAPLLMGHPSGTPALMLGMPSIGEFLGTGDVLEKLRVHEPSHHLSDGPMRGDTRRALTEVGYEPLLVDSVPVYGEGLGGRAGGWIHLYRLIREPPPSGSETPMPSSALDAPMPSSALDAPMPSSALDAPVPSPGLAAPPLPVDDRSMGRQTRR